MKNSFISLLIDVQNKQKEHRELLRKKKKIRSSTGATGPNSQRTVSTHVPGTVSRRLLSWTRFYADMPDFHSSYFPFSKGFSMLFFVNLFLFLLLLTPCSSSSLWRDSPMSFKTASVKLLATQEGTNRWPRSLVSLHICFCAAFSYFPPACSFSFSHSFLSIFFHAFLHLLLFYFSVTPHFQVFNFILSLYFTSVSIYCDQQPSSLRLETSSHEFMRSPRPWQSACFITLSQ